MNKNVIITIHGKASSWSVQTHLPQDAIDAMTADGVEVGILYNTIPMWVAEAGLASFWCFWQDVFNFRNPFK